MAGPRWVHGSDACFRRPADVGVPGHASFDWASVNSKTERSPLSRFIRRGPGPPCPLARCRSRRSASPITTAGHLINFQVMVPVNGQSTMHFDVLVEAKDASDHLVTGYTGTVTINLGAADGGAGRRANYPFTAADHGEHRFQVTLAALGSQKFIATDTAKRSITGSNRINIKPAPIPGKLLVITPHRMPPNRRAGECDSEALDASGHLLANYTGTVSLASGPSLLDTNFNYQTYDIAQYTFSASDHGEHTFQAAFQDSGLTTVTAVGVSGGMTVTGQATLLVPSARGQSDAFFYVYIDDQTLPFYTPPYYTAPHIAFNFSTLGGSPVTVVVTALDANNNTVTGYTGRIDLTSSDGSANCPPPILSSRATMRRIHSR